MLQDISAQSISLPVFKLNTEDRPLLDYSSAFGILLHSDLGNFDVSLGKPTYLELQFSQNLDKSLLS